MLNTHNFALGLIAIVTLSTGLHSQEWQATIGTTTVAIIAKPQPNVVPDPLAVQIGRPGRQIVELPIDLGPMDRVAAFNNQLFTVFVGGQAVVFDLVAAQEVDRFRAQRPSTSPDGRWHAYVRYVPDWVEARSAVYLVYDLTVTPAQNRMTPIPQDPFRRLQDVGNAVFPIYNFAGRTYEQPVGEPDGARHSQRSELVWLDNMRFALMDYKDGDAASPGEMSVVVVNLNPGVANAEVRRATVAIADLVDVTLLPANYAGTPADVLQASTIEVIKMTSTSYSLKITLVPNRALKRESIEVQL